MTDKKVDLDFFLSIVDPKRDAPSLTLHTAVRQGVFDGAISISAVQWLCNADKTCNVPRKRIRSFFDSLYKCLAKGGRAVLQIYPENATQADMLLTAAMKAGFRCG